MYNNVVEQKLFIAISNNAGRYGDQRDLILVMACRSCLYPHTFGVVQSDVYMMGGSSSLWVKGLV